MNKLYIFIALVMSIVTSACSDNNGDDPNVMSMSQKELVNTFVLLNNRDYFFLPADSHDKDITVETIDEILNDIHVGGRVEYFEIVADELDPIYAIYPNNDYFPICANGANVALRQILSSKNCTPKDYIIASVIVKGNGEHVDITNPEEIAKIGFTKSSDGLFNVKLGDNDTGSEIKYVLNLETETVYDAPYFPGTPSKLYCEMLFVQLAKGQKYEDVK